MIVPMAMNCTLFIFLVTPAPLGIAFSFTLTKLFDRLLWVPLRHLKGRLATGYNYEDLFYHEYFSGEGLDDGRRLARQLWQTLKYDNGGRTLFILDGLDEVSQDFPGDNDMSRFLAQLLHLPSVVITSRPNTALPLLRDVDLELETIGFFPHQVDAYLKSDPKIAPRAHEVRSFLQEHWLMQGLMRIPIQLDALCYTWDDFEPGEVPKTMTEIYSAIEQRLWRKDAVRLGKKHDGDPVTYSQIGLSDVEDLVGHEAYLLDCLAFTGLYNNVIDFTPQHQAAIWKHFKHQSVLLDKTLPRLSFLRTSDHFSEHYRRTYHFLHLTFQEYFAARYFVRHWISAKLLKCLNLSDKGTNEISPVAFFQQRKYLARYDVFWRFVVGLLVVEDGNTSNEGNALAFFQTIEEEPLDLLGPTHQRLVMYCLSEASVDMSLRQRLEEKLKLWLLFECSLLGQPRLSREMEFPEQALHSALQEGSDNAKIAILDSLQWRPSIPSSVNELEAYWLRANTSRRLTRFLLETYRNHPKILSDNVLMALVERLDDKDTVMQDSAMKILEEQPTLTDQTLTAVLERLDDGNRVVQILRKQWRLPGQVLASLVQWLDDKDWYTRMEAVSILRKQSSLPDEVFTAVIQRLGDKDEAVRQAAVKVLDRQTGLSKRILTAVVQRLDDGDSAVREAAMCVLRERPHLSDEILLTVIQRLGDEDEAVREASIQVLHKQSSLAEHTLMALIQALGNGEKVVRVAVLKVLQNRSSLSNIIVTAVAQHLDNNDSHVRREAVVVPQERSSLSDETLTTVIQRLDDKDETMRNAALWVLREQPSLSDEILTAVVQHLRNKDPAMRKESVKVLHKQSHFSEKLLVAVAQRLSDEDAVVRTTIVEILRRQSSLPDDIFMDMIQFLEHKGWGVRRAAMEVLQDYSSLPNDILAAAVQRLNHKDWIVRTAAVELLQNQSGLSHEILAAMVQRLNDEDKGVRRATLRALQRLSAMSDEVFVVMVQWLKDKELHGDAWMILKEQSSWSVKVLMALARQLDLLTFSTMDILQKQSNLPNDILAVLVQWLDHKDWGVRHNALKILQKQSNLSDETLAAVVQRLDHKDSGIRDAAVQVLWEQSNLPIDTISAVVYRLDHKDRLVRSSALKMLQTWASLSPGVFVAVVEWINGEDPGPRKVALEIQPKLSGLSHETLTTVIQRLDDKNETMRNAALWVLREQPGLSDEILTTVIQQLGDEDKAVRQAAVMVLNKQTSLSKRILTAVVQRLHDKDKTIRNAALLVLRGRPGLSDEILTAVIQQLGDEDEAVRQAALMVLNKQASLSERILAAVVRRLRDEDETVRNAALLVLRDRPGLSDEILMNVIQLLRKMCFDTPVLDDARYILHSQSSLSAKILMAMVQQLDDPGSYWAEIAILKALQNQPTLSDQILMTIVQLLDTNCREHALEVLQKQSSLSVCILKAVSQRLGQKNSNQRQVVGKFLRERLRSLPAEALTAIVPWLGDSDVGVQKQALKCFLGQPSLSDDILTAVVRCLDSNDLDVQRAAADVLSAQPSLSDKVLAALARLLESANARTFAEAILEKHKKFYASLLSGPYAGSLCTVLFYYAFDEQWSWCINGGWSCVDMPDGLRSSATVGNVEKLRDLVVKSRPRGAPHHVLESITGKRTRLDSYTLPDSRPRLSF